MSWFGSSEHHVEMRSRVAVELSKGSTARCGVTCKPRIMPQYVGFEELVGVIYGGNVVVAQLMKEPILHGTKGAFNPPLGLRRGRRQQFNA